MKFSSLTCCSPSIPTSHKWSHTDSLCRIDDTLGAAAPFCSQQGSNSAWQTLNLTKSESETLNLRNPGAVSSHKTGMIQEFQMRKRQSRRRGAEMVLCTFGPTVLRNLLRKKMFGWIHYPTLDIDFLGVNPEHFLWAKEKSLTDNYVILLLTVGEKIELDSRDQVEIQECRHSSLLPSICVDLIPDLS